MKENLLMYAILVLVLIAMAWGVHETFFGARYQDAIASEQNDICETPAGYTDEEWREHMSHHPDRYKDCL